MKRTELDTIINEFLLSELNAKEFIVKLNDDLFSNENLLKMYDYLKNNRQESVLEHFYEEQLISIPIHPNEIKLKEMNHLEVLEYIETLREDAFETRLKELSILSSEILPTYIKTYSDSFDNIPIPNTIEKKGLNYKGNFSNIERFHKLLERSGYIQIEYIEFKKFFQQSFIPNDYKILWLKNLNELYYLVKKIRVLDKNIIAFDRSNYREIIPFMFEYIPKNKKDKEILSAKILSQNNKLHFDTTLIDKSLNYLSKPEY